MPVPEATVNKNNGFPLWQNNIRLSWQVLSMQSVSEAKLVKQSPDNEFRLGVLGANARHHLRAFARIDDVSQRLPFGSKLPSQQNMPTSISQSTGLPVPKQNCRTAGKAGCPSRRLDRTSQESPEFSRIRAG